MAAGLGISATVEPCTCASLSTRRAPTPETRLRAQEQRASDDRAGLQRLDARCSYVCESGSTGTGSGCPDQTAQNDETNTRYANAFNVFVESDQTYKGKSYQVLYGGFQWGFTFTATDAPEPSTLAMLALGFAGISALGWCRRGAFSGRADTPRERC
jgi:hypothetical protein